MKYRVQFYYPMGGYWVTIKTSKYYEKVREAYHRFWQGCKLYEMRIISVE